MAEIHNINEHIARLCECGSAHFNLLRSGMIECAGCGKADEFSWVKHTVIKKEHLPRWFK